MHTTPTDAAGGAPFPLACVVGAIPSGERAPHFELAQRLFTMALRARRELANGYAYQFEAAAFDDIARWIVNERRCCPFLSFAIELAPHGGPVWLRLTGPAGTRAFLDAELPSRPRTLDR